MGSEEAVRHFWFFDELFLFNFRLVWPVNKDSLAKYVLDEFEQVLEIRNPNFGAKCLVIEQEKGNSYLVAIREWAGSSDDHATLAHECSHAAMFILADRGVYVTPSNDETLAYLTGYLVRRCLNQLMEPRQRFNAWDKCAPKQ